MTIHLSEHDEAIIRERVASGRYRDAAEAVHEALGLLDKLESEIAWLNNEIDPAQAQFDNGLGFEMTPSRLQEVIERGVKRAREGRSVSDAAAS